MTRPADLAAARKYFFGAFSRYGLSADYIDDVVQEALILHWRYPRLATRRIIAYGLMRYLRMRGVSRGRSNGTWLEQAAIVALHSLEVAAPDEDRLTWIVVRQVVESFTPRWQDIFAKRVVGAPLTHPEQMALARIRKRLHAVIYHDAPIPKQRRRFSPANRNHRPFVCRNCSIEAHGVNGRVYCDDCRSKGRATVRGWCAECGAEINGRSSKRYCGKRCGQRGWRRSQNPAAKIA